MDICVFGSSSRNLDPLYINATLELGRAMGARGHGLVFGGYDMGLMGAIAQGVQEGGGRVTGVVTEGLSARGDRAVFPCDVVLTTPSLALRKTRMIELSQAFITLPGGIGTLDELTDVLSQAKAGEAIKPCAIYDVAGFYSPLVQMLDEMCAKGLNNTDWRQYAGVFSDASELLGYLEG